MKLFTLTMALVAALNAAWAAQSSSFAPVDAFTYGPRPFYLIDSLEDGPLKQELSACSGQTPARSDFVIAHRGGPLQFPEHTRESYLAAARMGAGIIECDVVFTKDKELVCRHAQDDLHTTTNILATPLAKKCSVPFQPAQYDANGKLVKEATAECRTSDITLAEFKTLRGKMDGANPKARTVEEYMQGTPHWRTDLYTQDGTLMSFRDAIKLFNQLGVKMTPELKVPVVTMPFDGFTMDDYAQKMIDELTEAGVAPERVFLQSFDLNAIKYWIAHAPAFGKQALFLDEDLDTKARIAQMPELRQVGIQYLAPAMPILVRAKDGKIVPSEYAKAAKAQGFKLISWSIERSGPLANGGGWYYSGINNLIHRDSDLLKLLDVLAKDVGIVGLFSDWPATVTYYANCKGL